MSTCRVFDRIVPSRDSNIALSFVTTNSFPLWCLKMNFYRNGKVDFLCWLPVKLSCNLKHLAPQSFHKTSLQPSWYHSNYLCHQNGFQPNKEWQNFKMETFRTIHVVFYQELMLLLLLRIHHYNNILWKLPICNYTF